MNMLRRSDNIEVQNLHCRRRLVSVGIPSSFLLWGLTIGYAGVGNQPAIVGTIKYLGLTKEVKNNG